MTSTRRTFNGVSLSRGPALILGGVLLAAGLFFLYRIHTFPHLSDFPSAHARIGGHAFLGIFGVNGWSGELTAVAGGLLLLGAAEHHLAKTASFVVAVALGGVAIWALLGHNSGLGLFATNIWTVLLWAGAAVLLLVNVLLPRAGGVSETVPVTAAVTTRVAPVSTAPVVSAESATGVAPVSTAPVAPPPVASPPVASPATAPPDTAPAFEEEPGVRSR